MLSIQRAAYDRIVEHAERGESEEVCGLLGGHFGNDHSVVASVHPATNVAEAPESRYLIDPAEQLELMDRIEEDGEEIVGFYHSHPAGPARPSPTDADRAAWPDRSYLIVSLDGRPSANSWRWNGDEEGFEPESLEIVEMDEEIRE